MWLKLLQKGSIAEMIKPTLVNGKWRKPMLSGRNKHILKSYFEKAGVPWIYEEERPEVHIESTYNRRPKLTRVE